MPLLSGNRTDDGQYDTGPLDSDAMAVGYWWSNVDFEWWPVTLGEIREASGNTSLDVATARKWWEVNYGGGLRLSKPRDNGLTDSGGAPISTRYQYDGSGRTPEPTGGRGGGRGGGSIEPPVYRAPDKDAVREQIKMYVVATTGTANSYLVDKALNAYLESDKLAFDRDVAEAGDMVDPFTSVKGIVRNSAEYKAIHQLRPESVDELEWVTSRQAKLRSLGLSAERAESLGARQAQSGANDAALVDAAEMANVADTGRLFQSQRDSLAASARSVMGLI